MLKRICTFSVLAAILLSASVQAQTVDEIIEKHIAALGGKEKIRAIKSIKFTGKLAMTAMGMEAEITRLQERPKKFRMDIMVQGQKIVQAYDGTTVWQINPMMGSTTPQKMPESQAKSIIQQADMDGEFVDYKKKGHTMELVGKEDLEGTEVYKIKCVPKEGDSFHSFIDSEHHLELKRIIKSAGPGGNEIESEIYISDYKEVGGVMMAHSLTIKNPMQGTIEITLLNAELNADIDDSEFSMPEGK